MKSVTPDTDFLVMPQDQGQIVEMAYAVNEDYIIQRCTDRSCAHDDPSRVTFRCAEFIDGNFEPWNGSIPEHGDWEECIIGSVSPRCHIGYI